MADLKSMLNGKEEENARLTVQIQMNTTDLEYWSNFKMQYDQNVGLKVMSKLLKQIFSVVSNKNPSNQSSVVQLTQSVPNTDPQVVVLGSRDPCLQCTSIANNVASILHMKKEVLVLS